MEDQGAPERPDGMDPAPPDGSEQGPPDPHVEVIRRLDSDDGRRVGLHQQISDAGECHGGRRDGPREQTDTAEITREVIIFVLDTAAKVSSIYFWLIVFMALRGFLGCRGDD